MDILAYLFGILIFLFGIGLSIGLHEVGHMWPAKAFGGRVSRYMIGFGPTVFSRKKGETEYGIKLLPLGGYVAISGMFPPRPASTKSKPDGWLRQWVEQARTQQFDQDGNYDEARAFYRLSIPRRIVIMLGGPLMNLVLGVVITLVALSGIGSYQATNHVTEVLPCAILDYTATSCSPNDPVSPAKQAGLQKGDTIKAVNGKAVDTWDSVSNLLVAKPTAPLKLTVLRGGKTLQVRVTPVLTKRPVFNPYSRAALTNKDGSIKLQSKGLVGVQLSYERKPYDLNYSVGFIGYELNQTFAMIADLPRQVVDLAVNTFTGGKRSVNGPVSVLGVGNISGSIAENHNLDLGGKAATWLLMLGSLNFALFVFNLIPLLPLDGGHVLNALVEAVRKGWCRIRGKANPGPLDTARLVPFTMFMWAVLMAMTVVVVLADIVNPINLG